MPKFNDGQTDKIADFLATLKNVKEVKVLAYHNYAGSKYKALEMEDTLPTVLPTDNEIKIAQEKFTPR